MGATYHYPEKKSTAFPFVATFPATNLLVQTFLATSRFWIAHEGVFNAIFISVIVCSIILTFLVYWRVLKNVRRHENQINDQNIQSNEDHNTAKNRPLRIVRFKKSTLTMVFLVGIFILCYVPFLCVKVVYKIEGYTTSVKTAYLYASTIVFLNSCFNPVVYCWRITDIRRPVKELCSRCCGGNCSDSS